MILQHSPSVTTYNVRSHNGRNGQCNTAQVEYRLEKLELLFIEKTEFINSELREGNRRLQALEYDSEEARTALEGNIKIFIKLSFSKFILIFEMS